MREYPDAVTHEAWKTYPVRIQGGSICQRCGVPTLLVESMPGGFVKHSCPQCGEPVNLLEEEFHRLDLWIACPECKQRMDKDWVGKGRNNYGFVCRSCDIEIALASLLPRWEDLRRVND